MLPKDKIRITKHLEMATPADDTMLPEKFCQSQLGLEISPRSDTRHYLRALRLGVYVGHDAVSCNATRFTIGVTKGASCFYEFRTAAHICIV